MRYFLLLLGLVTIYSCQENEQKAKDAVVHESKLSPDFNRYVNSFMDEYYAISESFVQWDSANVDAAIERFEGSVLGYTPEFDSMFKDNEAKRVYVSQVFKQFTDSVANLKNVAGLQGKRESFSRISKSLFEFLDNVEYDYQVLYLQECPMAFYDTVSGYWLTNKGADSIRNPFLGLYHPRYSNSMIDCGGNFAILDHQKK